MRSLLCLFFYVGFNSFNLYFNWIRTCIGWWKTSKQRDSRPRRSCIYKQLGQSRPETQTQQYPSSWHRELPPAPETTARARKHSQKWQCNRSDVINLLIGYIMIQQRSTITQRLHSSEMVSKKKFKHLCAKPIHEPWLILHKYIQNAGTFRIICNEFHVKLAQFSHGHSRSMQALTSCFMSQCPTTKVIWAVLVKRDNPSYII